MKNFSLLMLLLSINSHAQYLAHEWGTFTSLMGSDGVRVNGLYHEDEELPKFVHKLGEGNLAYCESHNKACAPIDNLVAVTQKMETPVLYFYADRKIDASVDVGFPGGVISESYPLWSVNFPLLASELQVKNGFVHYNATILNQTKGDLPFVEKGNIYSHARFTKSNIVKVGNEQDKFIFYRGIGDFSTNLKITSTKNVLNIKNTGDEIPNAFLLNFDGVHGSIESLGQMKENAVVNKSILPPSMSYTDYILASRKLIVAALVNAGLYEDEAVAMMNTWEQSYLKSKGPRILYVLNRSEVEQILPMTITPQPEKLVRVFIGRVEILSEEMEHELLLKIENDNKVDLANLGRMAHPILNRLQSLAKNNTVLKLINESLNLVK